MYDLFHRLALAVLLVVGLATLAAVGHLQAAATLAAQHRQVMLAMLAGALILAPWLPLLRIPAAAAGILAKAALLALAWASGDNPSAAFAPDALQVVALLAAAAILLVQSRQEARWNGGLPVRREG
jgi:hypothetical protein